MTSPAPTKRLTVFIDDASVDGKSSHFGFGTLWMPWQRRGDFAAGIKQIRDRHGYASEIKWTKVKGRYAPFFVDLVNWFFDTKWLAFHCIVACKSQLMMERHQGRMEVARMKVCTQLLGTKMRHAMQHFPGRDMEFRVYVDPFPSSYGKADEAMKVISDHMLRAVAGRRSIETSLLTRDSARVPGFQLCDLLLGAVIDDFTGRSSSQPKAQVKAAIARRLDWPDLRADTMPDERKFNIWHLWRAAGVRSVGTRAVHFTSSG